MCLLVYWAGCHARARAILLPNAAQRSGDANAQATRPSPAGFAAGPAPWVGEASRLVDCEATRLIYTCKRSIYVAAFEIVRPCFYC